MSLEVRERHRERQTETERKFSIDWMSGLYAGVLALHGLSKPEVAMARSAILTVHYKQTKENKKGKKKMRK